jgi:hypothetical protein
MVKVALKLLEKASPKVCSSSQKRPYARILHYKRSLPEENTLDKNSRKQVYTFFDALWASIFRVNHILMVF